MSQFIRHPTIAQHDLRNDVYVKNFKFFSVHGDGHCFRILGGGDVLSRGCTYYFMGFDTRRDPSCNSSIYDVRSRNSSIYDVTSRNVMRDYKEELIDDDILDRMKAILDTRDVQGVYNAWNKTHGRVTTLDAIEKMFDGDRDRACVIIHVFVAACNYVGEENGCTFVFDGFYERPYEPYYHSLVTLA